MTSFERWYTPAGATISVEAGATAVQGSAQCAFTNQVVAGDALLIRSGPDKGLLLQVAATPATDMQLVIDKPWPGVTQAGLEFAILPVAVKRSMAADIHARVSALYASLLHPFKVAGQPSDELGADGSIAIDQAARQFWIKSAGAWGTPLSMVGEVSSATLAAELAALRGGASAAYDTLKKVEDKLAPILAGGNTAYDTFAEIYAYITSDQSAAGAINAALGNRVRVDAAQGLTAEQQAQARANIGAVSSAGGTRPSLIVNGDFALNQRAFAFGALADGVFGVDRWKAVGATNLAYAAATRALTINAGGIRTVVETAMFGPASLAGQQVTLSFETNVAVSVSVGSAAGVVTGGAGVRQVSLNIAAGDVGHLAVTLTPQSYPATIKRVKLELGAAATDWVARPMPEELRLCQRYYHRVGSGTYQPNLIAFFFNDTTVVGFHTYPAPMFANPTLTVLNVASWSGANASVTATLSALVKHVGVNHPLTGCTLMGTTTAPASGQAGNGCLLQTAGAPYGILEFAAEVA